MSTIHRSRRGELIYRRYLKDHASSNGGECILCKLQNEKNKEIVKTEKHFFVVKNIFPYTMWDSCNVVNHLMVIPKKHVSSLSELNAKELMEFSTLIASYENKQYGIYARPNASNMKSIAHQHTHLIKTDHKKTKILFYIERPIVNIRF